MKNLVYFLLMLILFIGCNEGEKEQNSSSNQETDNNTLIEDTPADPTTPKKEIYQEFHPNGKLKIQGKLNENGNREGLWMSYYDNGIKWSESYYVDGKRDGHSLTFYPNGQVRYVGEYKNDEKTGTWRFYDEEGNLTNEENF